MNDSFIDPAAHRQLFLDDGCIESTSGVKRTLHQPRKRGPVLRPDRARDEVAVQTRNCPNWNPDKGLWELWYWGTYEVPPHGPYQSSVTALTQYATSADGVHWQAPSLGLFEWRGSKDNNIVLDPHADSLRLYHVLRDENDPDPARRYKGLFGSQGRCLGVSPDGLDWTILDVPSIPSSDESHFTYDESTGRYLALVKTGTEWGRSVSLATSTDFVHWTEPKLIFHSDEIDKENGRRRLQRVLDDPDYLSPAIVDDKEYISEVYNMAVMPYEGIYIGFPGLFNPAGAIPRPWTNHTGIRHVELTVSRNLYDWERVADRAIFIPIEPWDGVNYGTSGMLSCGRPVVRDNEIWIYYNASRYRGDRAIHKSYMDPKFLNDRSAVCLATLRQDRFVSFDADGEGEIVTQPFAAAEGQVRVNVDATGGELRAEIIDAAAMRPLPGLSAAECVPLECDALDAPLRWEGDAAPPPGPVRLRFRLRRASLYSFRLEARPPNRP